MSTPNDHNPSVVREIYALSNTPAPYFSVSTAKFAWMSLTTAGLYELYWLYRNWSLLRDRGNASFSPVLRSLLAPFYIHSCLTRIRSQAEHNDLKVSFSVTALSALWIGWTALYFAPQPIWVLALLRYLILLQVQATANRINAHEMPAFVEDSRFSPWNIITMFAGFGGLLVYYLWRSSSLES